MPDLEIKDQPTLGPAKLFQLTVTAIRYRLIRSIVTTVVITVAVAFVVHMAATAMAGQGLRRLAETELSELRLADTWATRLTQAPSPRAVLSEWADPRADAAGLEAAARAAGLEAGHIPDLRRQAAAAHQLLTRMEALDPITRRALAGRASGLALLDAMAGVSPDERQSRLIHHRLTRDEIADLWPAVADSWTETGTALRAIAAARETGIRSLAPFFRQQSALQMLAAAEPDFREAVASAGFQLSAAAWETVSQRARARLTALAIESGIADLDLRRGLAAHLDRQPQDVLPSLLWRFLRSESHAAWYHEQWQTHLPEAPDWSVSEATALARENRREAALSGAAVRAGGDTGGFAGLGRRTTVLVAVSLLVCIVGITNAMLMSVTERYREIATLKCLGALDQSILWIFVLEALLLGLAGALVGALLGAVVALSSGVILSGFLFLAGMPWLNLFGLLITALLLGAIMAATASVYPSWKAARLPPLEAMRIE
ncbi:MAG: FtsX-like permease family protein [Puniceicoccaceae bacterium]|nr:MAG: FtsX-like permease family protein [Puniceicoccaceae bacterium]